MERDLILATLQEHQPDLIALGVKSLALFGSVARGEAEDESDIDILVTFRSSPVTFDVYMDLKIYLEDLLGHNIDLVITESLHPKIKPFVQQDAVYVA